MIPMVFNIVLFCLSLRTSTALKTVSENTYVSSTCKSCAPKATTDIFHSSKQRIIQGHLQVTEAGGLNLQVPNSRDCRFCLSKNKTEARWMNPNKYNFYLTD